MEYQDIVHGYDDGYYRPGRSINKAELYKIVAISFGYLTKDEADRMIYGTNQEWYEPYENVLEKSGIVPRWFSGIAIDESLSRGDVFGLLANVLYKTDGLAAK